MKLMDILAAIPIWAWVVGPVVLVLVYSLGRKSSKSVATQSASIGSKFKEKFFDSLAEWSALGVLGLVGFGVLQAFIGDYKLEKTKESITSSLIERSNKAVSRESELVEQVTILKAVLQDQDREINLLKEQIDLLRKAPLPPGPPMLPPLPGPIGGGVPNVQQQVPNVQQIDPLKKYENSGAKNRLDFVQRHSEGK